MTDGELAIFERIAKALEALAGQRSTVSDIEQIAAALKKLPDRLEAIAGRLSALEMHMSGLGPLERVLGEMHKTLKGIEASLDAQIPS